MLVSMQLFTDIQMRVYRINGMLMDLSSEFKLIFVGKTFIVYALHLLYVHASQIEKISI